MKGMVALFCCGLLTVTVSCGLNEVRDRRATLETLLATNAPSRAVESVIGKLNLYKPGSAEWNDLRSHYAAHPTPWFQQLVRKIDKSAAFGWTSTMTMQTWVFLDDQNRLIDFDVTAQ